MENFDIEEKKIDFETWVEPEEMLNAKFEEDNFEENIVREKKVIESKEKKTACSCGKKKEVIQKVDDSSEHEPIQEVKKASTPPVVITPEKKKENFNTDKKDSGLDLTALLPLLGGLGSGDNKSMMEMLLPLLQKDSKKSGADIATLLPLLANSGIFSGGKQSTPSNKVINLEEYKQPD
ncbi:MAG: hypothetical protein FWE16_04685 [Firmicutes bacterium]|nr:hypothetical protein [Bacillota bacterium]